jgi:L-ribulose-5-phosphate 4-epimerase
MYKQEKQAIIDTALEIKRYGLIQLSGGNVSMRMENGDIVVTPSGMSYEAMSTDQVLVLNAEGEIIEGDLRPSVDTVALLYIYEHCPDVNAIIHTHQPYATAAGLISDRLPACTTTLCNVTLGEVCVAPYSDPASVNMGIQTVNYLNGKRAVILKHHGVVTVGGTLKEALYAAIYMEDSAKCYLAAKSAGEVAMMTPDEIERAVNVFKDYGQDDNSHRVRCDDSERMGV